MVKLLETIYINEVGLGVSGTGGNDGTGTSAKSRAKKSRTSSNDADASSSANGTSAKDRAKKSKPQGTDGTGDGNAKNVSRKHRGTQGTQGNAGTSGSSGASATYTPPKYNLYALNNAQRLERDGLVVDCDDAFPFPIKKDEKFCRSKKIGEFNKCFFNHDLKNIAGEDLIIYLKDLGFTMEDGVDEFSYNEILKTCSINENKSILRKIIKENTIKILSEYLNK